MQKKSDGKAAALESAETIETQNHGQALADVSFPMLWQRGLELARQCRQEDLRGNAQEAWSGETYRASKGEI